MLDCAYNRDMHMPRPLSMLRKDLLLCLGDIVSP